MWKQKIADNLVSDSYIFIFVVINIAVLAVIYYCIVEKGTEHITVALQWHNLGLSADGTVRYGKVAA